MTAGTGISKWLLLAAIALLLALFGGFLLDAMSLNLANIQSMKGTDLRPGNMLTTWGSCRQAHITGRSFLLQGRYDEALPPLQEGAMCSDDPWAWFDLGRTQYALGDLDGAAQSWQHTSEGYDQAVQLATAAAQEESPQDVWAAWQFAAEVNPAEPTPYIQLARLAAESDPDQVEPLLQQAVAANPAVPAAYIELGNYYLEQGDTAAAQSYFEQALALDPTNVSLLVTLAENAAVLGETPAAIAYWQEVALRSERRRALAYFRIGLLAFNENNFSSALAFYRRAVEIEAGNAQFLLGLADTYFELGCFREAAEAYQNVQVAAESEQLTAEAQQKLDDLAAMTTESTTCPDGS